MQKLIFQAQRVDERDERLGGEKTLRAELEEESVRLLRCNDAAGAAPRLQQRDRNSGLLQVIGAREAGNSPANHKYGIRSRRGNGHETSIGRSERF